jgi:hypothetical protein
MKTVANKNDRKEIRKQINQKEFQEEINMNTMVNYSIDDKTLGNINAGTFTENKYHDGVYECLGFKLTKNFIFKDEFVKDGKVYTEAEANKMIAEMGYTVEVKGNYIYVTRRSPEGNYKTFIILT